MRIWIVRPAPHWSTSRSTPWEKSADKTAPVSACVRLCSTAKKSPTSASRRTIPAVAQRAIFLRRFWLMLDQRAASPASYRSWLGIGEWPCQCLINAVTGKVLLQGALTCPLTGVRSLQSACTAIEWPEILSQIQRKEGLYARCCDRGNFFRPSLLCSP
jgi:hypothetical protein